MDDISVKTERDGDAGRARAYLARTGIGIYVYDVLRLVSLHGVGDASRHSGEEAGGRGGGERAKLAFAAKYFAALATGNHVFGRSYDFIASTTFNATCFAIRYASVLIGMSENPSAGVPLSCALCRSAARLVCPDFPARIVRVAWRLMLLLHDGEASAKGFARAMHTVMLHDGLIRGCSLEKDGNADRKRRTLSTSMLAECAAIKLDMCVDDARDIAGKAIVDVSSTLSHSSSSGPASSAASSSSSSSSSSVDTTDDSNSGCSEDEDACSADEAVLACFIQRRIESRQDSGERKSDYSLHLDDMDSVTSLLDRNAAKLLLPSSSSSSSMTDGTDDRNNDEHPRQIKASSSSPLPSAVSLPASAKTEAGTLSRSKSSRAAVVRSSSVAAADARIPMPTIRTGFSNNTLVRKSSTRPVSAPHHRKPSV